MTCVPYPHLSESRNGCCKVQSHQRVDFAPRRCRHHLSLKGGKGGEPLDQAKARVGRIPNAPVLLLVRHAAHCREGTRNTILPAAASLGRASPACSNLRDLPFRSCSQLAFPFWPHSFSVHTVSCASSPSTSNSGHPIMRTLEGAAGWRHSTAHMGVDTSASLRRASLACLLGLMHDVASSGGHSNTRPNSSVVSAALSCFHRSQLFPPLSVVSTALSCFHRSQLFPPLAVEVQQLACATPNISMEG
ncbi:hypothetical protein B0H63DRAFT_313525 [Podospora didyma]|uniref:Uncharacterized protein n=1 Tax=Podospora didyma TaxID=330526 RepID=A0AAE0K600_9PEZI|nr:hypothetical protein B0H63DRAFT_313525 [Podospora didyma]